MSRQSANRQKSKPVLSSPGTGKTAARPSSTRLFQAVLIAGIAVAFLGYRVYVTLSKPRPAPRLTLGADVPLLDPPPLPGNDLFDVRARLQPLEALRADPKTRAGGQAAHLSVAQQALHGNDPLAAYEEFREAFRTNPPTDPEINNAYGLCALQLGLYAQALEIYKGMVARTPERADGYIGLARAQYYLGAMRQSVETLDRAVRIVPANNIPDRLHLAFEFESKGALDRALSVAEAILAAVPNDPLSLKVAAQLQYKRVHMAEARQLFEKLVAAHPEDAAAATELAAVVDNPMSPHRDRALAEHMLLETLQRDPKNAQAFTQLGAIYQEQGRYRQAAYVYVRLLQLTPDSAAGRMQLSRAYDALGDQRRAAEQREIGQKLLERDQTESHLSNDANHNARDPKARLAVARFYIQSGQFSDALEQLQAAFCLAPASPDIRRALSALYDQIGVPGLKVDMTRYVK